MKENVAFKHAPPHRRRVAIIGGGITGLTTAYDLTQKGVAVEVSEREVELVGLAAPIQISGGLVERFYHLTFYRDIETLKLLRDLGIDKELSWKKTKLGIFHEDRLCPLSGLNDLFHFQPLGLLSGIRFAMAIYWISCIRRWKKLDRLRVMEWGRRLTGDTAFKVMLNPLLLKKFGKRYREVSATWLWGKTIRRAMSRSGLISEKFGCLSGSFKTFYEAIAKSIQENGRIVTVFVRSFKGC